MIKQSKKFNDQIIKNKGSNISRASFVKWVNNNDVSLNLNVDNIQEDWEYLENRILANLASSIFGKDYYYYVLLNEDKQFLSSLEHIKDAKSLIK